MQSPMELTRRVDAIDALRGFDMFWIIGGGTLFRSILSLSNHPFFTEINKQFTHAAWHGFRFWDGYGIWHSQSIKIYGPDPMCWWQPAGA